MPMNCFCRFCLTSGLAVLAQASVTVPCSFTTKQTVIFSGPLLGLMPLGALSADWIFLLKAFLPLSPVVVAPTWPININRASTRRRDLMVFMMFGFVIWV